MSNNKDIENAQVKKEEKKPNKLKVWWSEHWGEVVGTAATIAGTAGIIYFGKKGLDKAMEAQEAHQLLQYGKASGLNLLEDSGTYCEKLEKAVSKIREDKGLDELKDTIEEKVNELNELCKDKGVEVMLGATLGTDGNSICELDTYMDNLSVN